MICLIVKGSYVLEVHVNSDVEDMPGIVYKRISDHWLSQNALFLWSVKYEKDDEGFYYN